MELCNCPRCLVAEVRLGFHEEYLRKIGGTSEDYTVAFKHNRDSCEVCQACSTNYEIIPAKVTR